MAQKVPRLADGALRYMASLYDSRGTFEGAWVPKICRLSQKSKIFARGSFGTGTSGFGIFLCGPTLANNLAFSTASDVTSAGTATTLGSAYTLTSTAARMNAPFTAAQGAGTAGLLQGRVVGFTLYVRFAGTVLNEGGSMVLVEHPDHLSLLGYSYNTAMALDGAKRVPVEMDKWYSISWVPTDEPDPAIGGTIGFSDTEFGPFNAAFSPAVGVFIQSAVTAQYFEYEVYSHVEYAGELARSPTLSFNDPIGFDAIVGAGEQFEQLDSVLGIDGFIAAVETQLLNQSLPAGHSHQQNWVGLLSYLPALKQLAQPLLDGASRALGAGATAFGASVAKQLQNTSKSENPKAQERAILNAVSTRTPRGKNKPKRGKAVRPRPK